jgi:hypothetical protein
MKLISILAQFAVALSFVNAQATILPPNDLHLQDDINRRDANITESQFNKIIDNVIKKFDDIVAQHGADLTVERKWTDSTVNAYASQEGKKWIVSMFGGLARRPEITNDGFALVVCHELGHHLGGFVFKGERWASAEGQADYFATQVCARQIWKSDLNTNENSANTVDPVARAQCNKVWTKTADQNLCYRTAMASQSLATLLAFGNGQPKFDKPDAKEVATTYLNHPAAQCRLDTYFNGALCDVAFDLSLIPGKNHPDGQASVAAEKLAAKYSCTGTGAQAMGSRPRCWFKSKIDD